MTSSSCSYHGKHACSALWKEGFYRARSQHHLQARSGGGILVEYKRGLAGNRDSKFQEMKSLDVTDCNQYSWNGPPAC
jgi:hypothetical protein